MVKQMEMKEAVKLALESLNTDQKSVVVLRYIEGLSTKETSELLQLPQGTILSRLSRGLDKMKAALKDLGFEMD